MMQATRRARRQPAWPMLASEFGDSTLHEQGSGEFDPLFVITKLGAKVNRLLVAGLLERIEPRETSNGSTLWQGQLRDPSGLHYFSVGDYASESMKELIVQLSARAEQGETIMLIMVAKGRYFQSDEGSIYTSLRPEEAAEISRGSYREWLVEACGGMLERMDAHSKSQPLDSTEESYLSGGIPKHLCNGLLLANAHYGEIDIESYRLNILQALDIAEDRAVSSVPVAPKAVKTLDVEAEAEVQTSDDAPDLKETILGLIDRLDKGEGVDFNNILSNATARGIDRDAAEGALDELSDEGSVHEPRFGWFKRTV